jgi:small-conductance mechanosensitive channel
VHDGVVFVTPMPGSAFHSRGWVFCSAEVMLAPRRSGLHPALRHVLTAGLVLVLGWGLASRAAPGPPAVPAAAEAAPTTAEPSPQVDPLGSPETAPQNSATCAPTPSWVTLDGFRVLEVRAVPGAQSIDDYALRASRHLKKLAGDGRVQPGQLVLKDQSPYTFIGLQRDGAFAPAMAVDDRAAACFGITRQQLAARYRDALRAGILRYRERNTLQNWLQGTALALLVLGIYVLWVRGQQLLNRRLRSRFASKQGFYLSGKVPYLNELLNISQVRSGLQVMRRIVHWSLLLLVSYLLIPLLLGLFPPTQLIAEGLRGQILAVVRTALSGVLAQIPNLASIAVILGFTVLAIRLSNAGFRALNAGQLRIPGFYPEWALPTARLAALFITLIGLALAYPYVPGSNSKAFQGAGLLLGVLAALGSSAIATNIISGLMLIYTRAFRLGDRVDINGTVGIVQERALLVTRVRTPRNELVSIPNATVIGASIVNFSFSRREIQQPVAIATTITIGYDVPWRKVHALMLAAAGSMEGISDEVEPYVIQTSLNDFHISYELTVFVKDAGRYRETLSEMLAALQDQFAAADVEILSPGYHAIRNGNASTVPKPSPPEG